LRRDMDYTGVNQPSERKRTTMPNQQTHFNMHLKRKWSGDERTGTDATVAYAKQQGKPVQINGQ
jgi:hypothetical protein